MCKNLLYLGSHIGRVLITLPTYLPSGSTAGFLGEILSTGFNVVGFSWMSSPAATELECIVMDWLGEMLMLPKSFLF